MSPMNAQVVYNGDEVAIVFHAPGRDALVATPDSHMNFAELMKLVTETDSTGHPKQRSDQELAEIADKFDLGKALMNQFEKVTDRLLIRHGVVYWDGAAVNNVVVDRILDEYRKGNNDWERWAFFLNNLYENPSGDSVEQFYNFIRRHGVQLTPDGLMVMYKGVRKKEGDNGGTIYTATQSVTPGAGTTVDGVPVVDGAQLEYPIGAEVAMDRKKVVHDRNVTCSIGLHVANWDYATHTMSGLASTSEVLECWVNPRDVVSVPNDYQDAKVRVWRLIVVKVAEKPSDE
jgi:hypothetical protein